MNNTSRSRSTGLALALVLGCGPTVALAAQAPSSDQSAPSSPIGSAALRAAATDKATRAFYQKNGWHAVWTPSAAQALTQLLGDRAANGLDHVIFFKDDSSVGTAEREVALTGAALRYADALVRGIVDPAGLHQVYTLARPKGDVAGPLAHAIAQGSLPQWFASLAPQDDEYATLSKAYRDAEQKAQASDPTGAPIAVAGPIRVGDSDERVPAIGRQLASDGYLPAGDASRSGSTLDTPSSYTQPIADAVKQLQQDYGITSDGVVGPDTLGVLNLQPGDRARALAVALERRRWLDRTPPATRIDVNLAAARLRYYRDGSVADSRKVIVGKPGKETPLLMAPIYRLVANPTWTIPKSIENGEMANVTAAYLDSHNMVRRGGYIVQQPGPDNALGLVKFDMQDDQAIYLHDTGSPALFDRSQRHLSHGCVRVDDALGFADMIAQDEGVEDKWQQAHASGDTQYVPLPHKLPVRLLYQNVFVDDGGAVAFRTDPYGWNGPVAEALGFSEGSTKQAQAGSVDIGP